VLPLRLTGKIDHANAGAVAVTRKESRGPGEFEDAVILAFDAHLLGIDPDYRLHVSERLLGQKDGSMLESLKRVNGGTIHLPSHAKDRALIRIGSRYASSGSAHWCE
jgi:hypothetical protein